MQRVDSKLNAIKGGGACQLREKVLAEAAKTFIIVADYRKNSELLGTSWTQGVPIEVAEFAWSKVQRQLVKLGSTQATLRMGKMKAGPVVTDNGCVKDGLRTRCASRPTRHCADLSFSPAIATLSLTPSSSRPS